MATAKTAKSGESNKSKKTSGKERVIEQDGVRTIIRDHVVAKIAGVALAEVEGIHSLVPFDTGQKIEQFAKDIQGSSMRDLGVHVEVGDIEAAIDTRIVVDYGVSIPEVAKKCRDEVSRKVEGMTGLKLTELNIEIVDLYFENETDEDSDPENPRVR